MLLLRWFTSRRVRHAVDVCRQVRRLTRAQRDLLAPAALERVAQGVANFRQVLHQHRTRAELDAGLRELEKIVDANLRPYPHASWRENIEVCLVTGAVVLALRTFFFQPMAIPSGSAQPTLWGITRQNLIDRPDVQIPGRVRRFIDSWWSGTRIYHVVAKESGTLNHIGPPRWTFFFLSRQTLTVGARDHTIYYASSLGNFARDQAGLAEGMRFDAGQDIVKLRVTSGDHLFVNRMIYNFRRPRRGEIIVFSSRGLRGLMPDTHYIKRLVALGGERVRIGDDRHVVIDGRRLDASTPGFENVYGFNPNDPPRESHYSGHVNGTVGRKYGLPGNVVHFPDENAEFVVRPKHYLPIGDNTMNSHDGRAWGDIPQEKVIGRASFVFWPISQRFGWGYR